MHQAMLAQAVLDKVVERATALGVTRVGAVQVLLGEDDEHTEDALRYAWSEVSVGTCAEGAEFVIERTPGEGLRLAAMDVERAGSGPGADPQDRPSAEEPPIG
jgi:hydrogenase nickel incorporation protein HypA/HybF